MNAERDRNMEFNSLLKDTDSLIDDLGKLQEKLAYGPLELPLCEKYNEQDGNNVVIVLPDIKTPSILDQDPFSGAEEGDRVKITFERFDGLKSLMNFQNESFFRNSEGGSNNTINVCEVLFEYFSTILLKMDINKLQAVGIESGYSVSKHDIRELNIFEKDITMLMIEESLSILGETEETISIVEKSGICNSEQEDSENIIGIKVRPINFDEILLGLVWLASNDSSLEILNDLYTVFREWRDLIERIGGRTLYALDKKHHDVVYGYSGKEFVNRTPEFNKGICNLVNKLNANNLGKLTDELRLLSNTFKNKSH